uniref:PEGA domain-containing protein n=1 Tax=Candidatus Kentrum sp. TUN TaxID=2126343 RepID=A0A450ZJ72_9GAMM|nr:MAG: PEGA domain-containing protein [Candidatus Kentron sp. TUN]VFK55497.1 MAG: PEGA domain-containing protein [Candidatus Kentron sp. TUN]
MGTAQGAFAHPSAKLIVRSNVSGDIVTIDGKPVGSTGTTPHTLSPGEHEIRVEKKGFEPFEAKITLAAGAEKNGSSGFSVSGQFDSAVRSFAPKGLRISAQGCCAAATLGRQGLRNQP